MGGRKLFVYFRISTLCVWVRGLVGVLWAWLATGNVWSKGSGPSPAEIIVKELRLNLHIRAPCRAWFEVGEELKSSLFSAQTFHPQRPGSRPSHFSSAIFKTGHCDVKVVRLEIGHH
ncbi:hypothetical protein F5144DRAFT_76366 [Chaetomium tenue]|uniref:Uncharacterized protein n=1 Tax=Chaetomium tenue TaxID=1854479 RepID=A0ACB7PQK0_9PEZI|nr:hypothetical protein F5144DRAFT_76366 [Chaetomium globosum]